MNETIKKELESLNYERPFSQDGMIDVRVKGLIDNLTITDKKILDIGSLDGYHACQLAYYGAKVTTMDIRPSNLHKALYRSLNYGYKMNFKLLDMEDMSKEIKKDEFDIIFHSGAFYHLFDPVRHLHEIKDLAEYILLETHVADGKEPLNTYFSMEKVLKDKEAPVYIGWRYTEPGWEHSMASKDERQSLWLTTQSLKQLFKDCDLEIVATVYEGFPNTNGPRNCYLLKRA